MIINNAMLIIALNYQGVLQFNQIDPKFKFTKSFLLNYVYLEVGAIYRVRSLIMSISLTIKVQ